MSIKIYGRVIDVTRSFYLAGKMRQIVNSAGSTVILSFDIDITTGRDVIFAVKILDRYTGV